MVKESLLEYSEESNLGVLFGSNTDTTSFEPKRLGIFAFKVETKGIPTLSWKDMHHQ